MEKNIKQAPKAKETEVTNSVENEKSLKSLKYSYEMYEKTKKETVENMKNKLNEDGTKRYTEKDIEEQIKVIETAENAVKTQYLMLGGKEEDLLKKTRRGSLNKTIFHQRGIIILKQRLILFHSHQEAKDIRRRLGNLQ